MMLPVYVADWQIADGSVSLPAIGMAFEHVLVFYTEFPEPDMHYGYFGREATVTGVAEWLRGP